MVVKAEHESAIPVETLKQTDSLNKAVLTEEVDIEWRKCKKSVRYFIETYVFIADRNMLQTLRWEPWDYLVDLLSWFQQERFIIILKARQLGISWLVVAYCLWKCLFFENAKILFLSKGEREAGDLIGGGDRAVPGKAKFIYNHLPDFLRLPLGRDTHQVIDFPATGSVMEALPSTQDAGRSTDASIVVGDEWEYHPYAELNFASLFPTIEQAGQFIGMSTADKTKIDTFFKTTYIKAQTEVSKFKNKFLSCYLRPGRDKKWREDLFGIMPSYQVEGEYPETEQDALTTLKTIPFFDNDILEQMVGEVTPEIKDELSDKYKTVKIFKPPVVGNKYVVFTDPSDGKEDPHFTWVKDVGSGEQVAVSHGKVTADYCAEIHDALVRYYKNALNSYELNARAGGIFSQKIGDLDTPDRCGFVRPDGSLDKKKFGWWTSRTLKGKMEQSLEEFVRLRKGKINYIPSIREMQAYMRPEGEDPQAPRGGHDDSIIAGGGCEQISRYVKSGEITISSFSYQEV